MASEAQPIDITSMPELVHLAEEVRDTNEPGLLRRDSEDLAKIIPLRPRRARWAGRQKTAADLAAFLDSAGGWSDVDVDAFLIANRESRDRSASTRVEL